MAANSISYSQFSMFQNCRIRWYNEYALNKRVFEQSIHTIFGTAMHETLQHYLTVMYGKSVKEADALSLSSDLRNRITEEYKKASDKMGHFSTPEELYEFWQDGVACLNYFQKNRRIYFPSKQHELLGIETELAVPLIKDVVFKGFIDVVIKDHRTGRIKIIDLKTSTRGWNKYQKKDKTKTAQLVLYKEFYAKQFNVDPETIDVEYIILRRKINEELEFVPKRVQLFVPASGKPTRNKVGKDLFEFIETVFKEDGSYNMDLDINVPKCKDRWCKYCRNTKK